MNSLTFRAGITDICQSFVRTMLWLTPGWYDFILKYRRTVIGPFWETVVMAAWVGGLGLVADGLFGGGDGSFFAYVSVGVVIWFFMNSMVASSADLFTSKGILILSINNPLYTYVLRHIVANAARFLLQAPVVVATLAIVATAADSNHLAASDLLMAVAGLAVLLATSLWVALVIGLLGARFHDLQYILGIAMRFLFFVTPVFWKADDLGDRAMLARANPFTHFLATVRAPLTGEPVGATAWTVVLAVNAIGLTVALLLYGRYHRRIAFWI